MQVLIKKEQFKSKRRWPLLHLFAISAMINFVVLMKWIDVGTWDFPYSDYIRSFSVALSIVAFIIFFNEDYWSKKLGFKELKYNEWGERIE